MSQFLILLLLFQSILLPATCENRTEIEEDENDPHVRPPTEKKLLKKILEGYDAKILPVVSRGIPVAVQIKVSPKTFSFDKSMGSEIIYENGMLYEWTDHRLSWIPADYDDIRSIKHVRSDRIWKPDIHSVLTQEQNQDHELLYGEEVSLSHDGKVSFSGSGHLHGSCSVLKATYPFDEHTCETAVGSKKYDITEQQILIMANGTDSSKYRKNRYWTLTDFSAQLYNETSISMGKERSMVKFNVNFRRNGTGIRSRVLFITGVVSIILLASRFLQNGWKRNLCALILLLPLIQYCNEYGKEIDEQHEWEEDPPLLTFILSFAKLVCFIFTCDVLVNFSIAICSRHTDILVRRVLPFLETIEPVLRFSPARSYSEFFSSSGDFGMQKRHAIDAESQNGHFIPVKDMTVVNLLMQFLDLLLFIILCLWISISYVIVLPGLPT